MAEFINPMAYVEDNTVSDDKDNKGMGIEDEKVNWDSLIDGVPVVDNNLSDYYGFTNVSQTYSSTEEDVHSESDMRDSVDENVDARSYWPNLEASDSESDIDDFKDVKLYIEKVKESLIIPFRFIIPKRQLRFVILRCLLRRSIWKTSKDRQDKCLDDELRGDLPKDLFDQLDAIKSDFVWDLVYQCFEKQCSLINKLLMNHLKWPTTIPNHLKTTEISCNQPQTTRY